MRNVSFSGHGSTNQMSNHKKSIGASADDVAFNLESLRRHKLSFSASATDRLEALMTMLQTSETDFSQWKAAYSEMLEKGGT